MHAYLFFLARRGQRDFLLAITVNRLIGCPQSVGKILRMSILQMV